ncbi:hypothetical protein TNCV_1118341 [Trichonephila clavipes]|uniref:Uncharacterized protein n=1 Tax=Trichonephila clavipes TaxID=2585209 RepID=A0A8X6VSY5_TRICX|nr:hypothetical protein TNCV_1118341 [Trichonephila clavipes]
MYDKYVGAPVSWYGREYQLKYRPRHLTVVQKDEVHRPSCSFVARLLKGCGRAGCATEIEGWMHAESDEMTCWRVVIV